MRFLKASLLRNIIQSLIAFFLVYAGWQFVRFVRYYDGLSDVQVPRPQSVDGFLPINALIAAKNWVVNYDFDPIHPAGLVIFLAIIAVSTVFRKSFCSWICPIGTLSEGLWRLGNMIFGRNFTLPRFLDIGFRSIKYLILIFFLNAILVLMPREALYYFIRSPYVAVADVKMLKFFINLSTIAFTSIVFFALASVFIRNFWCRYLCPYGALLGITGLLSPFKVKRDVNLCDGCNTCYEACPNSVHVNKKVAVNSPECSSCLNCVNVCPQNALSYRSFGPVRIRTDKIVAAAVLALFFGLIFLAQVTGNWQSQISDETYKELIPQLEQLGHANPY